MLKIFRKILRKGQDRNNGRKSVDQGLKTVIVIELQINASGNGNADLLVD